ncbi:MAG TPA: GGDEF domain-containing protein [Solirubrobacterales bacterium]|nr:GGDEF domain-containing protein [Solirubrobacterales bacterium]
MSNEGLLILAVIEAVCLLALGAGALVLVRRLKAGREALWTLSRRDALTGVGNYRALHERLAEEIGRHARRGREFALILIDLDGFKQINEDLGHLEGDRLLAEIGTALCEELRGEDAVFRQGGDEFAVIAPETNGEEAEDVAARIRNCVRRCSREELPISGGTGFAIFPGDGRSAEQLLGCADADLLGSKRGGRS